MKKERLLFFRLYSKKNCTAEKMSFALTLRHRKLLAQRVCCVSDSSIKNKIQFFHLINPFGIKPIGLWLVFFLLLSTFELFASTDKYRVIWVDDPSSKSTIAWNQVSGNSPMVHYDVVDHGANHSEYAFKQAPTVIYNFKGMNNHFTRLENLKPNTVYYFIISDSEGASERFSFRTAPDSPRSRLSIIAGGDSRNSTKVRINANKMVAKLRPHVVIFGGDMTNFDTDEQWDEWLDHWQYTISSDGRITPIIPARGNHERSNETIQKLFDTNSKVYYALNLGGNLLRVYTLNSNISVSGDQTEWLSKDLASATACNTIWKMAQYHKPMRPHTRGKSEGNSLYTNWASLFYKYNVNLVLDCDSHTCKSTWPIRPSTEAGSDEGFLRDDENGTVYVGEGCWGAPLRKNDDAKSWTRSSGMFNQFKWIFVDKEKIEARTIRYDNVDQVGQVEDSDLFALPSNLDVWSPLNGDVITIKPSALSITTTAPVNQQFFYGPAPITITAAPKHVNGIRKVEFFVNGKSIGIDADAPYSMQWIPRREGNFLISTSVTNNLGLSRKSCVNEVIFSKTTAELTVFNAYSSTGHVQTRWESISSDLDFHEIQRAGADGVFKTIHMATSSKETQIYWDKDNPSGLTHYRLKTIDNRGITSYSRAVSVNLDLTLENIVVFPNPANKNEDVNLEFDARSEGVVTVSIFNIEGKLISQRILQAQYGSNSALIATRNVVPGVYLVKLTMGKKTFVEKLIFE